MRIVNLTGKDYILELENNDALPLVSQGLCQFVYGKRRIVNLPLVMVQKSSRTIVGIPDYDPNSGVYYLVNEGVFSILKETRDDVIGVEIDSVKDFVIERVMV